MAITNGQNADANDFLSVPNGSGKGVKTGTDGRIPTAFMRFGGDGTDGALSITSGTTTLAMGAVTAFIKNYTSISITGTGKLAFSGPNSNGTRIFLKSQGNVTLTSSTVPLIDLTLLGAAASTNGYMGNTYIQSYGNNGGSFLASGSVPTAAGGSVTFNWNTVNPDLQGFKYPYMHIATAGGNGGADARSGDSATAGTRGLGAGSMLIECAGALNFTGTITATGQAGTNGTGTHVAGCYASSGGGGGGGGFVGIIYNTLTANSGTVNITGGAGGTSATAGSGNSNSQGGAGGGGRVAGGDAGGFSSGGGLRADPGIAGGNGYSFIVQNTEFA